MLAFFLWANPLRGDGYQFWSGIGSDFSELALLTALVAFLRHRNCHVKGCWRLGHADTHGWPACKHHHSRASELGRA